MKLVSITAIAFLGAMAMPAFAQQANRPAPPTPEERAAQFVKADANKDGKLSKAEWSTTLSERAKGMADQIWQRLDADGDGSVTKEQFLAPRQGGGGGRPGGGGN